MNTDDLRNLLNDQNPEGLDGEQMLRFARRARRNRRVGGVALGVAAGATAIAVAFGTGAITGPHRADIASAAPVTSSPASTPPASTTPVSSAPATRPTAKVTGLCAPTNTIATPQLEPGVVAVGPRGELVITSDGPNAKVTVGGTTTTILTLPETQGVATASTDGRFIVLVVQTGLPVGLPAGWTGSGIPGHP